MEFYDIHDQTLYKIVVSKPENVEDLSDLFITKEELSSLVGREYFHVGAKTQFTLDSVVSQEILKWGDKLIKSKKKTLAIDDEELLDVIKERPLSSFLPGDDRFARRSDRICFAKSYKRKKVKATRGDLRSLWTSLWYGFYHKYGCYPPHIPVYDRSLAQFKAWKGIVGWRLIAKTTPDKTQRKFYRQIWDNPEEFM
jgi:hypothetical protein